MKILGIDPATRNMGYSIVEFKNGETKLLEAGLLRFKKVELKQQIRELNRGIELILKDYDIDEVSIENIFFAYNPKSVLKLAQFRGALCMKILSTIGDYNEYTPLQIKKALTGNGKASKEQVAFMVKQILGIKKDIKPLDITDAIAIAITHSTFFNRKS
jgi:crossover junction endodeoxyribonuclease RuvC